MDTPDAGNPTRSRLPCPHEQITNEACPDRTLLAPMPTACGIVDIRLSLSQIDQRAAGIEYSPFSGRQVRD
jgi:hypothetical protein